MKILLPLFILIFAFVVNGQTVQEKIAKFENAAEYKSTFDKFKDATFVSVAPMNFEVEQGRIAAFRFGTTFFFVGDTLKTNIDEFLLDFSSRCRRDWCFLDNNSLIFLADGVKIDLGKARYNGRISTSGSSASFNESMFYSATRKDLTTIANAKTAEFQIGTYENALTEKHKQMLKNMLALGSVK